VEEAVGDVQAPLLGLPPGVLVALREVAGLEGLEGEGGERGGERRRVEGGSELKGGEVKGRDRSGGVKQENKWQIKTRDRTLNPHLRHWLCDEGQQALHPADKLLLLQEDVGDLHITRGPKDFAHLRERQQRVCVHVCE
jgi:hypothetical protein